MSNWPPRSYRCSFCRRLFTSAQALGGHMNVHRRDRARYRLSSSTNHEASSSSIPLNHSSYDFNATFIHNNVTPSYNFTTHNESSISLANSLSTTTKFDAPTLPFLFHNSSKHNLLCSSTFRTNMDASKESDFLLSTKSSARSPPLVALPLLKERCGCHCMSTKSCTSTKPTNKYSLHQTVSLKGFSNNTKLTNLFDYKGSHHESRSLLLLKDTLSSCNIVDLELRLGHKHGT